MDIVKPNGVRFFVSMKEIRNLYTLKTYRFLEYIVVRSQVKLSPSSPFANFIVTKFLTKNVGRKGGNFLGRDFTSHIYIVITNSS